MPRIGCLIEGMRNLRCQTRATSKHHRMSSQKATGLRSAQYNGKPRSVSKIFGSGNGTSPSSGVEALTLGPITRAMGSPSHGTASTPEYTVSCVVSPQQAVSSPRSLMASAVRGTGKLNQPISRLSEGEVERLEQPPLQRQLGGPSRPFSRWRARPPRKCLFQNGRVLVFPLCASEPRPPRPSCCHPDSSQGGEVPQGSTAHQCSKGIVLGFADRFLLSFQSGIGRHLGTPGTRTDKSTLRKPPPRSVERKCKRRDAAAPS